MVDNVKTIFVGGPLTSLMQDSSNTKYKALFENVVFEVSKHVAVHCAHIEEDFGQILFSPTDIASRDLRWIRDSDLLVFIFPICNDTSLPLRTDGTFIELGYAIAHKKEAMIFMPNHTHHSLLTQGVLEQMKWKHYSIVDPQYIINAVSSTINGDATTA